MKFKLEDSIQLLAVIAFAGFLIFYAVDRYRSGPPPGGHTDYEPDYRATGRGR